MSNQEPIDLFEGMNNQEASQQGVYLSPGLYELEIKKCLVRDTARSGRVFLVETTVVKSSNPDHPEGASRTWIQGMKNKQIGQRAVMGFLFAALGYDIKKDEDAKVIKEKIQPNSPALMSAACRENKLAGKRVKAEVTKKRNQEDTKDYNLVIFSPIAAAAA